MHKFDFDGIGTKWFIDLNDLDFRAGKDSEQKIKSLVSDFEEKYSRFKDTSEVGKLNLNKFVENPSSGLLEMLSIGSKLNKITKGSFDLLVGTNLTKLGYDKNLSFQENKIALDSDALIIFEKNSVKISKNSLLDLGGIGKGYLIDKVVNLILENDVNDFIVNAGGDIYAQTKTPSLFYLENPFDKTQAIGEISVFKGSIACSSSSLRRWKINNKDLHHLIDMQTGNQVHNISSVFTYGNSSLQTDLASTAIFVSNKDCWESIKKYLDIEFLVVYSNGQYFKTTHYPGRMYLDS